MTVDLIGVNIRTLSYMNEFALLLVDIDQIGIVFLNRFKLFDKG